MGLEEVESRLVRVRVRARVRVRVRARDRVRVGWRKLSRAAAEAASDSEIESAA